MRILYSILIQVYAFVIHIASLFNAKARLWVKGRKNYFDILNKKLLTQLLEDDELFWFHCASLGEFEQGRPLIEKLKARNAKTKILLTFFSPSGYEVQKNYTGVDFVFYLPIDSSANAKQFVTSLPLKAAFFVKYEFWYNYLFQLKKKNVPTYLVAGVFRETHYFFKWYGGWSRKQLTAFAYFFVQDEKSKQLLNTIGFKNSSVSGDTRFDRVYEIAYNKKEYPLVKQFVADSKVLIGGSTWDKDEQLLSSLKPETLNLKLILVPHEVDETHIKQVINRFSVTTKCLLYSEANENTIQQADVLIIDTVGMLSSLYQYATIAYIGGGFGNGIHNVLEAATFGVPTIFGPNYKKFNEAMELLDEGGSFTINKLNELDSLLTSLLSDAESLEKASRTSKEYVLNKKGATEIIMEQLKYL